MRARDELASLQQLPLDQRADALADIGVRVARAVRAGEVLQDGAVGDTVSALVDAIESGLGDAATRLALGEALGQVGDPRLRLPTDDDYWADVIAGERSLRVGRYPVTNHELRRFVEAGGYSERAHWSDDGWGWLSGSEGGWAAVCGTKLQPGHLVANQPVVGVSWYEAQAYAAAHGARLPNFDERMRIVRGPVKRPYPWGEPFGRGNANTREESLDRPCAVGLYRGDQTPEGVFDLAGNVAEWVADVVDDKRLIAPGAWSQESMSSWAKARAMQAPTCRGFDLGFRLVRD